MAVIDCKGKFRKAAEFYANKLGIPSTTFIAIRSKKHLKGQLGYCERIVSADIDVYLIVLEDKGMNSIEDPLTILAHEMVHVKQYVRGELQDYDGFCMWKNQRIDDFEVGSEDYYFAPWEIEAYGMQVGLYRMFIREELCHTQKS